MKKQEKHKQMQKKDHEVDKEKVIKRLKSPYSATKNIKADLHARFSWKIMKRCRSIMGKVER